MESTVLVVDDNCGCRGLHKTWLSDTYHVRTARNGSEALRKLDGVSVVVLDRQMPGLSGTDVLERIRDSEYDPKVVFVSSLDPDPELGGDAYLQKPISRAELYETVSELSRDPLVTYST